MMGLLTVISTTAAVSSSQFSWALAPRHGIPYSVSTLARESEPLAISAIVGQLRGGETAGNVAEEVNQPTITKNDKKKGKARKKNANPKISVGAKDEQEDGNKESAKRAISEAMKETDAATALGNAIR